MLSHKFRGLIPFDAHSLHSNDSQAGTAKLRDAGTACNANLTTFGHLIGISRIKPESWQNFVFSLRQVSKQRLLNVDCDCSFFGDKKYDELKFAKTINRALLHACINVDLGSWICISVREAHLNQSFGLTDVGLNNESFRFQIGRTKTRQVRCGISFVFVEKTATLLADINRFMNDNPDGDFTKAELADFLNLRTEEEKRNLVVILGLELKKSHDCFEDCLCQALTYSLHSAAAQVAVNRKMANQDQYFGCIACETGKVSNFNIGYLKYKLGGVMDGSESIKVGVVQTNHGGDVPRLNEFLKVVTDIAIDRFISLGLTPSSTSWSTNRTCEQFLKNLLPENEDVAWTLVPRCHTLPLFFCNTVHRSPSRSRFHYRKFVHPVFACADEIRYRILEMNNFVNADETLHKSKVEAYRWTMEVHNSKVEEYQWTMEVHNSKVEEYQWTIEAHKSKVEAYQRTIEAHKSKVEAYKSATEAHKSKVEVYKSALEAHKSKIQVHKLTAWIVCCFLACVLYNFLPKMLIVVLLLLVSVGLWKMNFTSLAKWNSDFAEPVAPVATVMEPVAPLENVMEPVAPSQNVMEHLPEPVAPSENMKELDIVNDFLIEFIDTDRMLDLVKRPLPVIHEDEPRSYYMEHCGTRLDSYFKKTKKLTPADAKMIVIDVMAHIIYWLSKGFVHMDIRAPNIVIDEIDEIKRAAYAIDYDWINKLGQSSTLNQQSLTTRLDYYETGHTVGFSHPIYQAGYIFVSIACLDCMPGAESFVGLNFANRVTAFLNFMDVKLAKVPYSSAKRPLLSLGIELMKNGLNKKDAAWNLAEKQNILYRMKRFISELQGAQDHHYHFDNIPDQ